MVKTLFHGSERIIKVPLWHGGKPHNDYGYGFYCTESEEMAKEWAVTEEHDGFANRYEMDVSGLRILHLNRDHTILTWLAVLLQNRTFNVDSPLGREAARYLKDTFSVDLGMYDAVCGYRADDSYFSFAQDFLNGTISYGQLREAMFLGELGMQFVVTGKKAFDRIRFISAERAMRADWLERKLSRDRKARQAYLNSDRFPYRKGELYIASILDEEMRPDDIRLR